MTIEFYEVDEDELAKNIRELASYGNLREWLEKKIRTSEGKTNTMFSELLKILDASAVCANGGDAWEIAEANEALYFYLS